MFFVSSLSRLTSSTEIGLTVLHAADGDHVRIGGVDDKVPARNRVAVIDRSVLVAGLVGHGHAKGVIAVGRIADGGRVDITIVHPADLRLHTAARIAAYPLSSLSAGYARVVPARPGSE